MQKFNSIIQEGQDGYLISKVIELPGCCTQAKSMDELIKRTKEAIVLYLECQEKTVKVAERFIGLHKITI